MVLPQLVQKQKRKARRENADDVSKNETLTHTDPDDMELSEPKSYATIDCELPLDKSSVKDESVAEVKQQESLVSEQPVKKRGESAITINTLCYLQYSSIH